MWGSGEVTPGIDRGINDHRCGAYSGQCRTHAPEQQRQTPISPSTSTTMADEQAPEIQINVKGAHAAAPLARAY